jgi:aspartyl-tRNA(Asn)/glutamyl-tRNA(Gln) amidotransferase subunit A
MRYLRLTAIAVSTGMSPIALGTDTGGSLRVPSSLCGVVGLKPTYGRVSKHGVFPLAPSLDHVGCITRSVWDAAAILECISGWDPYDQASSRRKIPQYTKIVNKSNAKGFAIGVPKEYFFDYMDCEVERLFNRFVDNLKSLDYKVSYIGLQNYQKYCKTWRDIRYPEATAVHEDWFKTRNKSYSLEVRKMLILGTKVSAVDYLHAKKIIDVELKKELLTILKDMVDVIIVPTTIIPALRFDELDAIDIGSNLIQTREALLRNTIVFNSTGFPAVSIPIGLTKDKMPIGAEIIGPPFGEERIL